MKTRQFKKVFFVVTIILIIKLLLVSLEKKQNTKSINNKNIDKLKNRSSSKTKMNKKEKSRTLIQKKIYKHFLKMEAFGQDAEKIYQNSIDQLKKNKKVISEFLIDDYENTKEENFLKRQQITETLRAIESTNSIPFFTKLLLSPFPEEKSEDLHHGSTQLEEGIIRLTAIEGLGYFSKKENNEEVLLTLLEIIKNEESPLPLKRQAIREYLQSSDSEITLIENKKFIKTLLSSNEHFLVTEKVDQPETQTPDSKSYNKKEPHFEDSYQSEAPII